jgi:hypothetical protein
MSAPQTICLRRLAANQANAQLSTGPKTSAGKAVSSLNAVKTGLTGRTVLLPSEDAVQYQAYVARFQKELQPVGERETELVQSLADTQWRLNRIPGLEFGLFAVGRKRYADLFEEETDEQIRTALLDAHILMTEAKHFKNLHLQESRLRRQYRQDLQELQERQAQRKEEQETEKAKNQRSAPVNGFEFTTSPTTDPNSQPGSHHKRTILPDAAPVQTQTAIG